MTLLEQAKAQLKDMQRQLDDVSDEVVFMDIASVLELLDRVTDSCHTCDTLAHRLTAVEKERDEFSSALGRQVAITERLNEELELYAEVMNQFIENESNYANRDVMRMTYALKQYGRFGRDQGE